MLYPILAFVLAAGSAPATSETLCRAEERPIFSCRIPAFKSERVLSLCATQTLSKEQGILRYRFGRAGNVELEYPAGPVTAAKAFVFDSESSGSRYENYTLRFSVGDVTYEVYSATHRELGDPENRYEHSRGVSVETDGKDRSLDCADRPVIDELSLLLNVIPGVRDHK